MSKDYSKIREMLEAEPDGLAAIAGIEPGAALPDVDILINNTGIFEPKGFFDIPDADWQRFFDVNVMSGVRLSRAYMPAMLTRNWGRIVFIASESGLQIPPEMIHYGVTKTAQLGLSRGLAELTGGQLLHQQVELLHRDFSNIDFVHSGFSV